MKTHKDLDVWKLSIDLVVKVYELTSQFPKEEKYGLINQMRKSSVSIPSNIAEGAARTSAKEFANFISISLGSLSELETQLIISEKLFFLNPKALENIMIDLTEIRKMLLGLRKSIVNKIK
jgi:four helix bundle protein